jgi:hypothetical protein
MATLSSDAGGEGQSSLVPTFLEERSHHENLSRDPDQEYFADGMTERLMIDLSKIGARSARGSSPPRSIIEVDLERSVVEFTKMWCNLFVDQEAMGYFAETRNAVVSYYASYNIGCKGESMMKCAQESLALVRHDNDWRIAHIYNSLVRDLHG